jgi:hypothetical protein
MLAISGCDSGDATPRADAAVPEAYEVCRSGMPADCAPADSCQFPAVPNGSTMLGYCSPPCTTNPDCALDYTGPGTPTCLMPDVCMIVCTDACPTGLTCMDTGGPVKVCAVPAA